MAGWLLPFVFLACLVDSFSRLGWRGWQGVVAVLSAHGGPMLIDLHSFLRIDSLAGVVA